MLPAVVRAPKAALRLLLLLPRVRAPSRPAADGVAADGAPLRPFLSLWPLPPRVCVSSRRLCCCCSSGTAYSVAAAIVAHMCALPLARSLVRVWARRSPALIVRVVVLPVPSFAAASPAAAVSASRMCALASPLVRMCLLAPASLLFVIPYL